MKGTYCVACYRDMFIAHGLGEVPVNDDTFEERPIRLQNDEDVSDANVTMENTRSVSSPMTYPTMTYDISWSNNDRDWRDISPKSPS